VIGFGCVGMWGCGGFGDVCIEENQRGGDGWGGVFCFVLSWERLMEGEGEQRKRQNEKETARRETGLWAMYKDTSARPSFVFCASSFFLPGLIGHAASLWVALTCLLPFD
jgi:hypothetical protein